MYVNMPAHTNNEGQKIKLEKHHKQEVILPEVEKREAFGI